MLKLKVECRRLPNGALENDKVYSSALQVRQASNLRSPRGWSLG